MVLLMTMLSVAAIVGVAATIRSIATDGYGRVPDRGVAAAPACEWASEEGS